MNMVSDTRFANRKGANKGTHSCHSCSAWLSTTLWQRCRRSFSQASFSLHSLTTSTSCLYRNALEKSTICWLRNCIPELEIRLHTGKTRTWNRAAEIPEGLAELGPEVWSSEGLKVLGSPVGTPEYIQEAAQERLAVEADFWRKIPWVPDLQCAWQLLVQCAGPRCQHFLRDSASQFGWRICSRARPRHGASDDHTAGGFDR